MNWLLSSTPAIALSISFLMLRYCAWRSTNGITRLYPSELVAQRQLKDARRAVRRDTAGCSRSQIGVRTVQVHPVKGVERFGAELQAMALGDKKRLHDAGVNRCFSGAFQHIPAKVAECARRVLAERVRIEIACDQLGA